MKLVLRTSFFHLYGLAFPKPVPVIPLLPDKRTNVIDNSLALLCPKSIDLSSAFHPKIRDLSEVPEPKFDQGCSTIQSTNSKDRGDGIQGDPFEADGALEPLLSYLHSCHALIEPSLSLQCGTTTKLDYLLEAVGVAVPSVNEKGGQI
ncbi:hypothetical protein GALMADRAFT_1202615 [Galerina marginata CBS 339.88]|uniref:Uncharacterized protein n=1 Tax=Galerina marginata (strain CBS 339.88) TaxID=685588 RepID=A0A067SHC3_GALM3|nr:hypothetical protein GALMADRAFT_1202615 [Galerina marginata CBS 339.88]